MATEIIMPKAGMDMEEGTIVRWLKDIGDPVASGEAVMEIETDKITMESEAYTDGVLLAKLYENGAVVPVTAVVGYIGEPGEKLPDALLTGAPAMPEADIGGVPEDLAEKAPDAVPVAAVSGMTKATPYAKTIAAQAGVDIGAVAGSGADGIVKARDVEMAARSARSAQSAAAVCAAGEVTPLAGMRGVIARRMIQSHLEIPPVTQNIKVYADDLLAIRSKINEIRESKITINDLVIKACAKAVAEFPEIRTEIDMEAGQLITRRATNIGVAVAIEKGLIVPVVFDADKLTLTEISEQVKDLASRAKTGKLSPGEYSGSTFTISNMGSYGIHDFTPIINQPNAAILGVGCLNDELALVNGQVISRKYMMLSLTYDHRIIDGATIAVFQNRIKRLLESPLEMFL